MNLTKPVAEPSCPFFHKDGVRGAAARVLRFVLSRQRFVRRCQGRDPGHTGIRGWPGQVKAEQIEGRVRPFPLCKTQGRTLLKWRRRRPGNLFVCAKNLPVEAIDGKGPDH